MDNRKHYFFDLDGTLTESRSLISERMTDALHALAQKADVIIISGAEVKQMEKQIPWIMDGSAIVMGQSGNDARGMWENKLTDAEVSRIMSHTRAVQEAHSAYDIDDDDRLELRGGQVSFSMIGHNADKARKKEYDPDGSVRREILKEIPFHVDGLSVRIGGTTCLDYSRDDWNKAGNIARLLEEKEWNRDACLYIGDSFFEGGNDAVMKDEMVCVEVTGPSHTLKVIEELLKI